MANSVEFQYAANLGMATINTANSNLDGTGTITSVITGGASGTYVKTLIIKAQTNTSEGMVRLYVKKGAGNKNLITEVHVPAVTKSSRDASYTTIIPFNYTLESGDILYATTQIGDTFNIIAEGFDISASATAAYLDSTLKYVWNAGSSTVTTANSNLDGTGSIVQVFTAAAAASSYLGCAVSSIKIKAQQTTTPGMIRLYIAVSAMATPVLFCEIIVPAVTQGATQRTFEYEVIGNGSLCIMPDYLICASTQNSETFSVVISAADWKYV